MDGRQLADFSLVDQPTIGLRLSGTRFESRNRPASIQVSPSGRCSPLGYSTPGGQKYVVQSGLHAFSWGLQRLGVVLAATLGVAMLIIAVFVVVLIGIEAAGSIGQ